MSKSIGAKIFCFLVIIILMQMAFIIIAFTGLRNVLKSNERMMDVFVQMNVLKGEIRTGVVEMELLGRLLVYVEDEALIDEFATRVEEVEARLVPLNDEMEQIAASSNDQQIIDSFAEFRTNVRALRDAVNQVAALDKEGKKAEAMAVLKENAGLTDAITAAEKVCEGYIIEATAASRQSMNSTITMLMIFMVAVGVAIVIVIIITILVITRTVARPARHASTQMHDIISKISREEGDLTERVEVKTKDEIGQLATGINEFLAQLQGIMQKLKGETEVMMKSAVSTMGHVNESNDSASNVSAAMEELAASMEEVAATIADIATASQEMLSSIHAMNGQAEQGANLVLEIKQRAESINEDTLESKRTIDNMVREIRTALEGAVVESRSVDKINELTDEILNISSQTNLLALNASIEAARAGEAGKGFAVVADEIRVLAENSKNTANNIQEISQLVTAAVEKLSKNAESMLQFIDKKVMGDYDGFVGIAKQYYDDADNMNQILNEFSMNTSSIEDTMKNVNEGINGISTTVDESAKGVASAAENAGQLVDAISQIQEEAQTSQEISNQLSHEVRRFKNV